MKISCPHCNQPLEMEPSTAGKQAECPACHGIFIMPVPEAASVREGDPPKTDSRNIERRVANIEYGKKGKIMVAAGLFLVVVGILVCWLNSMEGFVWPILVFAGILLAAFGSENKILTCLYCGYKGAPKASGGPNGCAFILLLLLGILPGLIYFFLVNRKFSCPECGTDVK